MMSYVQAFHFDVRHEQLERLEMSISINYIMVCDIQPVTVSNSCCRSSKTLAASHREPDGWKEIQQTVKTKTYGEKHMKKKHS